MWVADWLLCTGLKEQNLVLVICLVFLTVGFNDGPTTLWRPPWAPVPMARSLQVSVVSGPAHLILLEFWFLSTFLHLCSGCCFGLLGFGFSRSQLPYLINKRFLRSCHIKFYSDNVLLHPVGWRFYPCYKILTNYLTNTKVLSFPIWIKAIWKNFLLAFPFASFLVCVVVLVLFVSLSRMGW